MQLHQQSQPHAAVLAASYPTGPFFQHQPSFGASFGSPPPPLQLQRPGGDNQPAQPVASPVHLQKHVGFRSPRYIPSPAHSTSGSPNRSSLLGMPPGDIRPAPPVYVPTPRYSYLPRGSQVLSMYSAQQPMSVHPLLVTEQGLSPVSTYRVSGGSLAYGEGAPSSPSGSISPPPHMMQGGSSPLARCEKWTDAANIFKARIGYSLPGLREDFAAVVSVFDKEFQTLKARLEETTKRLDDVLANIEKEKETTDKPKKEH
ncbi:unnamed protein product [Vitrella brassicaformis CCMP3155]|uniref:Uncharacterized protein n=1 Tax=Vitrella brassicaformis (strain CCMP3155) TaxID=1169540 RepID=A0A0G4EVG1_VITBC|nr:unnamed protein product [Vitrella brassicaformis CCMP3155]|eukprot:CEM02060.1 unnamed protein product [Vitrella brassicaformis CCMP3155]